MSSSRTLCAFVVPFSQSGAIVYMPVYCTLQQLDYNKVKAQECNVTDSAQSLPLPQSAYMYVWDVTKTKMGGGDNPLVSCLEFGGVSPVTHNLTHFLSLLPPQ